MLFSIPVANMKLAMISSLDRDRPGP